MDGDLPTDTEKRVSYWVLTGNRLNMMEIGAQGVNPEGERGRFLMSFDSVSGLFLGSAFRPVWSESST